MSIVGMLEVVENDFSNHLAELCLAEDAAEAAYQKVTQQNKVTKVSQEQDVKYKEQETASLKRSSGKLADMCGAKADTH